jgi:hypothetical protein
MSLFTHATSLVAVANCLAGGMPPDFYDEDEPVDLVNLAESLEKLADNGYYDDADGAILLRQIAEYFRKKAPAVKQAQSQK